MRKRLVFPFAVFVFSLPIYLVSVSPPILAWAAGGKEKVSGYAEFWKGSTLVVDGQRVVATSRTKFKGKGVRDFRSTPLGYEVKLEGRRSSDGTLVADKVEVKPNGVAFLETDVLSATDELEKMWTLEGRMYFPNDEGKQEVIGPILDSGSQVRRVRSIVARLKPSYIPADRLRVRVVKTQDWNASAMGNGAIWVYSGLADSMSDDELAIILGHELAHYSHEHSRKGAKRQLIAQLVGAGALIGTEASGKGGGLAQVGALLGVTAWINGYGRDLEDQADRVGLRYAHEAGFDVRKAPGLWGKFREKYGENDQVSNFFFGTHSRPSDRIRNVEREIRLNY